MTDRHYPEAIRGAWFMLPINTSLDDARTQQTYDVLIFSIDNSYQQLQIKAGQLKQVSKGTYTFDGNFLITRSRNTDTYRITMNDATSWSIETRKGVRPMYRSLLPQSGALSPAQSKDLRILPIKARAEALFDHEKSPLLLAMGDLMLGIISVDMWEAQRTCWLGVTPLVADLELTTWKRIAHESVFGLTLDAKSAQLATLEVLMLHDPNEPTHRITL